MKKIFATMVALLAMTAAMAQQSDNKERRAPRKIDAQEMTDRMAKELNLDDAQKAKVLDLNKEYQDVLGGPGMGRGPRDGHHGHKRPELTEAQKAEMKQRMAKREEYDKKLKTILTDDQQKKLQEMHQRGGRGPRR